MSSPETTADQILTDMREAVGWVRHEYGFVADSLNAGIHEVERLKSLQSLLDHMAACAKRVVSLAPHGLPEETARLYGQEPAERMQVALEDLRGALAEYGA